MLGEVKVNFVFLHNLAGFEVVGVFVPFAIGFVLSWITFSVVIGGFLPVLRRFDSPCCVVVRFFWPFVVSDLAAL